MESEGLQLRLIRVFEAFDTLKELRIATEGAPPTDLLARLAVERCIEIISEGSRHVPSTFKQEWPNIDWRYVADIGNVLRHAYHKVDFDILWNIVLTRLDELEDALSTLKDRA